MNTPTAESTESLKKLEALRSEIRRHIVGQNELIERLLIALLVEGHVLLEGVPGLAKTRALTTLTSALSASMQRVQFTPDLLPSDLVGTEVYRPQSGDFVTRKGPLFANLVLADEINRAPAKVQSALLQAMAEREVSIGDQRFSLPSPFMVLATQNPIEQEGTYPLPEAQLDRFLIKVRVDYPSLEEELAILQMTHQERSARPQVNAVLSLPELEQLRNEALKVYVDPALDRYIVSLVHGSRHAESYGLKGMVAWGASPRASIALQQCARARAFLKGRGFATPDEVREIAPDVLRHRILPSFEAEARNITPDEIIAVLLKEIPAP